MKKYNYYWLMLCITAMFYVPVCQAQVSHDADEAFRLASETRKPVLLVFAGSDWCAPCMRFEKKILKESSFIHFATENIIVLKAEFPQRKQLPSAVQKQNDALAEQYNPHGIFPYLLLLGPEKEVMSLIPYHDQSPTKFISEIQSHLIK